jgi:hypothetical protein
MNTTPSIPVFLQKTVERKAVYPLGSGIIPPKDTANMSQSTSFVYRDGKQDRFDYSGSFRNDSNQTPY